MPSRAERRRQSRKPDAGAPSRFSALASREVLGALVLGLGVVAAIGGVLLFTGGDGEDAGAPAATVGATFSPSNADEAAIEALARRSIEVLPRNQWPELYDDFTAEFQARCSREEFVQAGIEAAQEQGANLTKLGYVRLEQVNVEDVKATATIIGEVKGSFEYQVFGAFQRVDGAWKLSAAADTAGCQAFNRP